MEFLLGTGSPHRNLVRGGACLLLILFLASCAIRVLDPSQNTVTFSYSGSSGKNGVIQAAMSVTPSALSASVGTIISCNIKAGSPSASSFPSTLSINPTTCKITGTPTASLSATEFTVTATSSTGATADATVTLSVSPCDVTASPYGAGGGTSGNPYLICTAAHLNQVRNSLSSYFKVVYDLDLTSSGMTPLSATGTPFSGSFDGDSHTISNWTYNSGATNNIGLFGLINGAAIVKNITLTGVTITGTGSNLGGLIGQMAGTSSVSNVTVSGTVTGGNASQDVGIAIGFMAGSTQLSTASSSGSVVGQGCIGGVVGKAESTGGTITLTKISSSATVNQVNPNDGVGGAVGVIAASGGGRVDITKSYATGNVSGGQQNRVGGFVGELYDNGGAGTVTVTDAYSTASVYNSQPTSVAGFAGLVGDNAATAYLTRVYVTGSLSVAGGLIRGVMHTTTTGVANSSYYNNQTTNASADGGGAAGRTTLQMQSAATYVGWDFTNTWNPPTAGVNGGFPTLR